MPLEDMENYQSNWWKYKLTVDSDRGPLTVEWSDLNELAKWSNIQAGLYIRGEESSLQTFFEWFPKWYNMWWPRRHGQGLFDLPDDAVIVDIGSGVAVQDLLLAKYLPSSKFTLVDKEGFEFRPGIFYDPEYPVYNSWAPVNDAIRTSKLDPNRFAMQGPDAEWPDQVDAVTSYLSWCWHYPKETYWQKTLDHLKIGGKFAVDVRLLVDRDVMEEINNAMNSEPISKIEFGKIPKHIDNMPSPNPDIYGYSAVWIRR